MEKTITFYTPQDGESKLIVMSENGELKEYLKSDKEQYLIDFPDRKSDVDAMNW